MGRWKQVDNQEELVQGVRIKDGQEKTYDVIGAGDQSVTLRKLGDEKLTLEYKASLIIQKVQIWLK